MVSIGIVWYHQYIKYRANMIAVSSQYRHDMELTVLCLSGIITKPILAILRKALMLKQDQCGGGLQNTLAYCSVNICKKV